MNEASIDGNRLLRRLDEFARIGATQGGGVNRQALSGEDRQARNLLAQIGQARGFEVFQDEIANLFLRRPGRQNALAPLLIGSHLDSQPKGGRFDGALGTLAALEVLETLEDGAVATDRPIELVAWTNEEGSRFSPGTMGSQAFRERHIPAAWKEQRSADGATLAEELAATLSAIPRAILRPLRHPIAGFIELHIEQGPALEMEGFAVGIVDRIQGTCWVEVRITGQTAHAGTTELAYRRDPMAAAVAAMADLYADVMPHDPLSRLTVGRFATEPGSINAIPSDVVFSVDIRHPDADALRDLEERVQRTCREKVRAHRCGVTFTPLLRMAPARFSEEMVLLLDRAAARLGLTHRRMASGAFHDALHIAHVAPTAMIFVPCRDGLSHNEAEYVEPDHIINGARMLLEATLAATHV